MNPTRRDFLTTTAAATVAALRPYRGVAASTLKGQKMDKAQEDAMIDQIA